MQNKKISKIKKLSITKIIAYIICFLIILFLALPLIFKDKKQNETFPFRKETIFDNYYNSFKNFYFSKNGKKQNQFAKIKNDLETKKAFSKISSALAEVYKEEEENSGTRNNYYLEEENYIRPLLPKPEEENSDKQNYPQAEEQNETFAIQEPYEDFLMEGLYETSQLDPYEAKQIAKQTVFDIFAPRTIAFLPSNTQFEQPLTKNIVLFNQNNVAGETKNILLNNKNQTNSVAASAGNYINGVFNPFSQNSNLTKGKIDIKGLTFEDQASLVASKLNTVNQNNQYRRHSGANNPGKTRNRQNHHTRHYRKKILLIRQNGIQKLMFFAHLPLLAQLPKTLRS